MELVEIELTFQLGGVTYGESIAFEVDIRNLSDDAIVESVTHSTKKLLAFTREKIK